MWLCNAWLLIQLAIGVMSRKKQRDDPLYDIGQIPFFLVMDADGNISHVLLHISISETIYRTNLETVIHNSFWPQYLQFNMLLISDSEKDIDIF